MTKGKFGIVLCAYPIVAFAAVILRAPWLCGLAFAAAAFLEKDEWAGRQSVQALMLALLVSFLDTVFNWLASLISYVTYAFSAIPSVFSAAIYLAAVAACIYGIVKTAKGQEANLPVLSELADKLYGRVRPRPIFYGQPPFTPTQPTQPGQPGQPYPQQPAQPGQPIQPEQPAQPPHN